MPRFRHDDADACRDPRARDGSGGHGCRWRRAHDRGDRHGRRARSASDRSARRRHVGVGADRAVVRAVERGRARCVAGAFEHRKFHLHVPSGAIPKDGPSAGITMTTALASLVTGRPVKPNVGMTGEVTLQGRVLPIGGLKQKLLAAHRAGLTDVVIPIDNEPDLDDVPEQVRELLNVHPVSRRPRRAEHRPGITPDASLNPRDAASTTHRQSPPGRSGRWPLRLPPRWLCSTERSRSSPGAVAESAAASSSVSSPRARASSSVRSTLTARSQPRSRSANVASRRHRRARRRRTPRAPHGRARFLRRRRHSREQRRSLRPWARPVPRTDRRRVGRALSRQPRSRLRDVARGLPRLIEQRRGGSIVNVSTIEAFRAIPTRAVYSAFKTAITGFTRSLAVEYARGRHSRQRDRARRHRVAPGAVLEVGR